MNIFDIMGPIMVGPSSSHTAGAARIGFLTRRLLGSTPRRAELLLHGSFAATGTGHGTDRALVAGLLGMRPDDARLPRSFELAEAAGMELTLGRAALRGAHPNTVLLRVEDAAGKRLEVTASSLGGGRVQVCAIDGLEAAGQGPLWRAVLEDDLRERGVDEARSWGQMAALWTAMKAPVEEYDPAARSRSGLTGGAGARLEGEGPGLCPPFLRQVIAAALKTGECNACMKRIVAAPTAGASGVLPAVLLPLQARDGLDDRRMVEALYVAAGFGQVIATRASISGAEGGCQAEVGSASGMAAAALVYVMGGTPGQMAHACAMALSNTLGLVCDPVAGLVEVPCVNRNVMGAVNALSCAEMALSGVESAIPCDEVIDAMRAVGDALPASLRETGSGGLAATPTGRRLAERL